MNDQEISYKLLADNFRSGHKLIADYKEKIMELPLSFLDKIGKRYKTDATFFIDNRFEYSEGAESVTYDFESRSLKTILVISFNSKTNSGNHIEFARPMLSYGLLFRPDHLEPPKLIVSCNTVEIVATNEFNLKSDQSFIDGVTNETFNFIRSNAMLIIRKRNNIKNNEPFPSHDE